MNGLKVLKRQMRYLIHTFILTVATMHMLTGGPPARAAGQSIDPLDSDVLYARVMKPYGAAIRVAPSSDATIMFSTRCGDTWPVVERQGGWVKIATHSGEGWIGGRRVALGSPPPAADCDGARFLFVTGYVEASVPTGCLSLRAEPSRDATVLTCVTNGHVYRIVNGPFDPGTGEDWFEVYSPSTGPGWSLADHLGQLLHPSEIFPIP